MKTLRIILWAGVVLMAGVLGWLTLAVTDTKDKIAEAPFGVPFQLVDQNGKPITEQAFRGKPTLAALGQKASRLKFGHGATDTIADGTMGPVRLFASYHCSRYNTNTRVLTPAMFESVFAQVRADLTCR